MNTLYSRTKKLGFLGLAMMMCSLAFGVNTTSALYSTADIDARLDIGTARAVEWDTQCRTHMNNWRFSGYTLRQVINGQVPGDEIGSYKGLTWLSGRNAPNIISPTTVPYGSTVVPLQVNDATFLCAALVAPDRYPGTTTAVPANPEAGIIHDEWWRWVMPGNANDRTPNRIGSTNMWPAAVGGRARIDGFQVLVGSGYISGGVGGQLLINRDDNSRYWFAPPVPVDYVEPGGVKTEQTIVVRVFHRKIGGYHPLSSRVEACRKLDGSGDLFRNGANSINYDECYQDYYDLSILIRPDPVYNFNLIPSSSLSSTTPSPVVSPGDSVTFDHRIDNSGPSDSFNPTAWAVKQFILPPGTATDFTPQFVDLGPGGNNCMNPYLSPPQTFCGIPMIDVATGATVFGVGTTSLGSNTVTVAPLPVGTKICQLAAVDPPNQTGNRMREGRPVCVTIGKSPTVQFYGGDVISGGNFRSIDSTCTTPAVSPTVSRGILTNPAKVFADGSTASSFGEYGVFSLDSIAGFTSGSSYTGNTLTFRNSPPTSLGYFYGGGMVRCITDLDEMFRGKWTGATTAPAIGSIHSLADGVYVINGDVTIGPSTGIINNVVLLVNGNVRITDNITTNVTLAKNAATLPRLVIAASNNIIINRSVTQVDAWLQAKNTLYTCDDNSDGGRLTNTKCNQPLVVNGLVSASKLSLRRTAGAEPGAANSGPAEKFILPPHAFITAYGETINERTYRTTYELELPPRY